MSQEERDVDALREELRRCRRSCRDIAHEIHDGPFHELTGLALAMAAARSGDATLAEHAARCGEAQRRLEAALVELRRAMHRLERCAGGEAGG